MLPLALFKYPAFFVLLKDCVHIYIKIYIFILPQYRHVEWPSEFTNISPLKQEGQNGWLTDGAAPLHPWEVDAAFCMLSKPASTVPVLLLIFVFDSMPQSYADTLYYRTVSSVLASRENREYHKAAPCWRHYILQFGGTLLFFRWSINFSRNCWVMFSLHFPCLVSWL